MARGGAQPAIKWLTEDAGFPMPPPGIAKPVYPHPPATRLIRARADFRKWQGVNET